MRGSFNRSAAGAVFAFFAVLTDARGAEGNASLPQLDVHSFSSQLFWLVVYFLVVYLFMRFVGIPRITAIVAARSAQIDRDLGAAEQLRKDGAGARSTYEATIAQAHGEARRLLAETHEHNLATLAEQTKAAAGEFDRKVSEAVQRIDAASQEALKSIPDMAASLAAEITQRLSGHRPEADAATRAVARVQGREAA